MSRVGQGAGSPATLHGEHASETESENAVMSDYLLELKNVTKEFKGGTVALDDMSLAVDADSAHHFTIAGESGSGKTTMGMLLLGFYTPTMGQVLYKGKDSARAEQARDV